MGMFYTSKRERALLAEINFWHLKYVESCAMSRADALEDAANHLFHWNERDAKARLLKWAKRIREEGSS